MPTDWKFIAEKMEYSDEQALLTDLYITKKLSSRTVAKIITEKAEYITGRTILVYVKKWGLKIRPKGGANNIKSHQEKLEVLEGKSKNMTAKEIAIELAMPLDWVYNFLRKEKIPFKRLRRVK